MASETIYDRLAVADWLSTLAPRPSAEAAEADITAAFQDVHQPLFRYLCVILHNPGDAEDVAQESFLRLHQEILAGRRVSSQKAWLFRAGHNLAIDRIRSRDGHQERPLDHEALSVIDQSSAGGEQQAIRSQQLKQIYDAVQRLSRQQRLTLHLRTEGFRYREIAQIMGVSESTVCENLKRGMARLIRDLNP